MSSVKEQIDFYKSIEKVTEKFEAAYETRKEDPEKWEAAKAAFQEQRTYWKTLFRAQNPTPEDGVVTVEAVSGKAAVHKEEND